MPPSQPAHPWHARLGHVAGSPVASPPPAPAKRRSLSQGDSPPEPAAHSHSRHTSTATGAVGSRRPAKRRRRASDAEHRLRPPPPALDTPPPPPEPEVSVVSAEPPAKTQHVQEKITDYFTKHIKNNTQQAVRVMKKEFLGGRPHRAVLQLGDDTAEVPAPEEVVSQRDVVLRALKRRRNGALYTPAASSSAGVTVCATDVIVTSAEKRAKYANSAKFVTTAVTRGVVSATCGNPASSAPLCDKVPCATALLPSVQSVPCADVQSMKCPSSVAVATPASAPSGDRLAGMTVSVTSPAEAEEPSSACRTPSETSSVDSGLGKERSSEPSTPSEPPVFEPPGAPVVRFPVRQRAAADAALTCCQWLDCGDRLGSPSQLLDHLQLQHVPRAARGGGGGGGSGGEQSRTFRCLWQGCKVYDRPGSLAWLERHVLAHGGTKPFRCIVDGCSHRFASQSMLERHVNQHFRNPPASQPKKADPAAKGTRRGGRRPLQQEEHPHSARIFDFCDPSAMERMRYQLVSADRALQALPAIASRSVQLTAQVIARRTVTVNRPELLVRWHPTDLLEDEWVPAQEFRPVRRLGCRQLPGHLWQRLSAAVGAPPPHRARRRKQGT